MRHKHTPVARILYAAFIGLAAAWMLVVLNRTATWDAYQAWGLAFIGAAFIAFIGLRLVTIMDCKWFIRDCNNKPKIAVTNGIDVLEPCQVGHRQPYFNVRG